MREFTWLQCNEPLGEGSRDVIDKLSIATYEKSNLISGKFIYCAIIFTYFIRKGKGFIAVGNHLVRMKVLLLLSKDYNKQ